MGFEEEPDYQYLKDQFVNCLKNIKGNSEEINYCYDWCPKNCRLSQNAKFFQYICNTENRDIEEKIKTDANIYIPNFKTEYNISVLEKVPLNSQKENQFIYQIPKIP